MSLSFGALAVNDIVAAAVAVTFVELATRAFYEAWPNPYARPLVVMQDLQRSRAARVQAVLTVDAPLLQGASVAPLCAGRQR